MNCVHKMRFAAALMLGLALTAPAAADDRRFSEYDNLNEAILAARATLDLFWKVVSLEPCGCSGTLLAVKLPWEGRIVDVDIVEVRRLPGGRAEGKVRYADALEVPELADTVVTFTDDDIVDWGFGRDGVWYGLFLFNAVRPGPQSRLGAAELEAAMRERFMAIRLPQ